MVTGWQQATSTSKPPTRPMGPMATMRTNGTMNCAPCYELITSTNGDQAQMMTASGWPGQVPACKSGHRTRPSAAILEIMILAASSRSPDPQQPSPSPLRGIEQGPEERCCAGLPNEYDTSTYSYR